MVYARLAHIEDDSRACADAAVGAVVGVVLTTAIERIEALPGVGAHDPESWVRRAEALAALEASPRLYDCSGWFTMRQVEFDNWYQLRGGSG
jgi:hypothetical protein